MKKNFNKKKLLSSRDYQFLMKINSDGSYSENITKLNQENTTKIISGKINNANNNTVNNDIKRKRTLSSVKLKSNRTNYNISQDDKKSYNSATYNLNKNNSNYEIKKNKSFINYANKTASTFFNTKLDVNNFYNNENNIDELVEKFNEIKLSKQTLFDYNSSLMSKLNFYRNQLNEFHYKELKLEEMKKNYYLKIKDIISDNYFNFEELTKDNQKCQEFLEKNEYYINKMKKKNIKKKKNKIIEKINKDDKDEEKDSAIYNNEEGIDIQENDYKQKIDTEDIVFIAAKNIIMIINNFFLTCSDTLKDIIVSINNINNSNTTGDKKNISKIEEDNSVFIKENNTTEENNNNPFIEVFQKIVEYQKTKDIDISNDYKLLLEYIKSLIDYVEKNSNILNNSDINELKIYLLDKFYKSGENPNNKKVDKLYVKRFLSKKTSNYNNIFTSFTTLSEPSIDNIKSLHQLIYDEINKKYLDNMIQSKNEIFAKLNSSKKIYQPIINSDNIINEMEGRKIKKIRRLSSSKSEIGQYEELCVDDEDNDSIDTQSTKKKFLRVKKRVKSIDEKVINKLYIPFLAKTVYLRKLNTNIPNIKQMTSNDSKTNYEIKKMISDVDTISYQMNIYNNPTLDPNKLCDNTYNSLVKLMLNNSNKNKLNVKGKKINRKKSSM